MEGWHIIVTPRSLIPMAEQRCTCGRCVIHNDEWWESRYDPVTCTWGEPLTPWLSPCCGNCGAELEPGGNCGPSVEELEAQTHALAERLAGIDGYGKCPMAYGFVWDGCIDRATARDRDTECSKEVRIDCCLRWAAEKARAAQAAGGDK